MADLTVEYWKRFINRHAIADDCVDLFETTDEESEGRNVDTELYPANRKNRRPVLRRSKYMIQRMRTEGQKCIEIWNQDLTPNKVVARHVGLLYMMLKVSDDSAHGLVPLYIGKASVVGEDGIGLSGNFTQLKAKSKGMSSFGRWGYGDAYHLGQLSNVVFGRKVKKQGTRERKKDEINYTAWKSALFGANTTTNGPDGRQTIQSLFRVKFWTTAWTSGCISAWAELEDTSLAFEESILIGLASRLYPGSLLNVLGTV